MRGAPLLSKGIASQSRICGYNSVESEEKFRLYARLSGWSAKKRPGSVRTRMAKKIYNMFIKYVQKTSCILCVRRDRMSVRKHESALQSPKRKKRRLEEPGAARDGNGRAV